MQGSTTSLTSRIFNPVQVADEQDRDTFFIGLSLIAAIACCSVALIIFGQQDGYQAVFIQSVIALFASVILLVFLRLAGPSELYKQVLLFLLLVWAVSMVFISTPGLLVACLLSLMVSALAIQTLDIKTGLKWSLLIFIGLSSSTVISVILGNAVFDIFQILMVYCFWSFSFVLVTIAMAVQKHHNELLSSQIERQTKDSQYQATHDELTGLPNKMLFHDRLTRAVSRAKRQLSSFAVMYVDINGFQKALDALGEAAGDDILQAVSHRLLINVRLSDTVARMENDEFAIILEQVDDQKNIGKIIDNLIEEISKPIDGLDQVFTATMGISIFPDDDTNADALLKQAYAASGIARENGDTWKFYGDCE